MGLLGSQTFESFPFPPFFLLPDGPFPALLMIDGEGDGGMGDKATPETKCEDAGVRSVVSVSKVGATGPGDGERSSGEGGLPEDSEVGILAVVGFLSGVGNLEVGAAGDAGRGSELGTGPLDSSEVGIEAVVGGVNGAGSLEMGAAGDARSSE